MLFYLVCARYRDDPKLLHQAQAVGLCPELGDLAPNQAESGTARPGFCFAGSRDAEILIREQLATFLTGLWRAGKPSLKLRCHGIELLSNAG